MIINTNTAALITQQALHNSEVDLANTMERLSSGKRINSAGDDAAGLAKVEQFRSQVKITNMAQMNTNDGISIAQTADAAYESVADMLQRMRELAVQSSNGGLNASDRKSINQEFQQLTKEMARISESTFFNNNNLLDGTYKNKVLQIGTNIGDTIKFDLISTHPSDLGISNHTMLSAQGNSGILSTGDLRINGTSINGTQDAYDTASIFDKKSSAISKAHAINLHTEETGVTARVNSNQVRGFEMVSPGKILTGTVTINGIDISISTSANDLSASRAAVTSAINQHIGETGVTAVNTDADNTGVELIAEDGRNISVELDTLTAASTGLTTGQHYGSYTLSSDLNITIERGSNNTAASIANSGLREGTYSTQEATISSLAPRAITLTSAEKERAQEIVEGLKTSWLAQSESLIKDMYGLEGDGESITFEVGNLDGNYGIQAYVQGWNDITPDDGRRDRLNFFIDIDDFASPDGSAAPDYDRVVAHEMTHAIMDRTVNMEKLPQWFREGAAEFIPGADARVSSDKAEYGTSGIVNALEDYSAGGGALYYSSGYTAVSFLHEEIKSNGGTGIKQIFDYLKNNLPVPKQENPLGEAIRSISALSAYHGVNALEAEANFIADYKSVSGGQAFIEAMDLANADTGAIGGLDADGDIGGTEKTSASVIPDTANFQEQPMSGFNAIWPDIDSIATGNTSGGAWEQGDLIINDVLIRETRSVDDRLSMNDKDKSAIAKVAAINSSSEKTGVTATVNPNKVDGIGMSAGAQTGSITINGIDTETVNTTDNTETSRSILIDAINSITSRTGVRAVDSNKNSTGIQLVAEDGRNISVALNSGLTQGGTGLSVGDYTGSFTLHSARTITIGTEDESNFAASGDFHNTGVYGTGESGESVDRLNISSIESALQAISSLENAIEQISEIRGEIGARHSRLESTVRNLQHLAENAGASQSRVEDADFATESTNLAVEQILKQASTAMLAQANQNSHQVLTLLQ